MEVMAMSGHPVAVGLSAEISVFTYLDVAARLNISDTAWLIAINGSELDSLLEVDFVFQSTGPISAPTDFTISGSANNRLFDWLSTSGVQYIHNIQSAIDIELASCLQKVNDWYATGGGQHALDAVTGDIDHLESLMLEGLGSAQRALGRAKQWLAQQQQHADAISQQIHNKEADLQDCSWSDLGCDVKNDGRRLVIFGLKTEQLAREAVVKVAEVAVDVASRGVQGAENVAVAADLETKYALQATYNASHFLVDQALKASQNMTRSCAKLAEFAASKAASVFNLQEVSFSGSYSNVNHDGTISASFKGVFFGQVIDHSFSTTFGRSEGLLAEMQQMMRHKWISTDDHGLSNATSGGGGGTSLYDRCNSFSTCSDCGSAEIVDGTICGWCNLADQVGECASGSATGPAMGLTSCSDWRFGTCEAPPPPPPPPPACPAGFSGGTCSGRGTCNTNTWQCACSASYKGSACQYACQDLTIPAPQSKGYAVDHCEAESATSCEGQDWVADQVCASYYPGSKARSYKTSSSCASKATYMKGGTCETHWWNFGHCQCHAVVNVICSNPAPYCQ